MTYSTPTGQFDVAPPSEFTLDPGRRIVYGPRSGDVYSIWAPDRDVEVMVAEEAAGGHSLAAARNLRDDFDVVVVALGVPGDVHVTALHLQRLIDAPASSTLNPR